MRKDNNKLKYTTKAELLDYITDLYLDPNVSSEDLQYAIDVGQMYMHDLPDGDLEAAKARANSIE